MPSFNRVIIDSAALLHNYNYLCSQADNRVRIMAMVKSDGYGHSLTHTARLLGEAGCRLFGVAEVEEGVALRESGCNGDIFVFMGFNHADLDYFFSHNLTPVVFTMEGLERISQVRMKQSADLDVYLKFDCGMARLGFAPSEAVQVYEKCRKLSLRIKGIFAHFPCSDDRQSDNSSSVAATFFDIAQQTHANPLIRSICNSGGLLYHPQAHGDMVRVGISLYGYYPDGKQGRAAAAASGLRPAMTCATRVIQINPVAAGRGIGYGHTYVTDRDTKLAVLPIGYSDGYFRTLSNRAEVLIKGQRAPIRGRICMNMCMADVTDIDGVDVGAEAILLGSQGSETVDADEIGSWCDTISYEILCALGNNNRREFR